jgi:predicted permease
VLGASPVQLLKQLIVENSVLVIVGTAGGAALAVFLLKLLKTSTALHLPRLAHASMSPAVLTFVIAISAAVTFFLTALPALRTLRLDLMRDLQGLGRSSAPTGLKLAGRLLVVAQLSLSVILMACAGWMIGSVYSLLHQLLGFTPDSLLMMRVSVRPDHPTTQEAMQAELRLAGMAEEIERLPEVESVAWTDHVPLGHAVNRYDFCSDLHLDQCRLQVNLNPNSYVVSSGYFSTIGQPLMEGRDFNAGDDGRNPVVIVNRALADREWPGQSALGHRIRTGEVKDSDRKAVWATVIGVVGNVHNYDLVSTPGPDLYLPRAEDPFASAHLVLRTKGDPARLKKEVRDLLKQTNPNVRVSSGETMAEEMASEVSERAFLMQVAIAFGAVALFLSIVGTYGLLAYEVSVREKEIGIRLALGSSRERIVALLLHEEGRWLGAGVLLGLGCAVMTGYALRSQFYNAHATSLPVLSGSVLLLALSALLAVAIPAGRASLQDPARTLRKE